MTKSVLKSSLFCATVGILALSACAQTNNPTNNNPDQYLSQYHWNLQSAVNKSNQALPVFYAGQAQPKVTLNFQEGRYNLRGSCNHMMGSYAASNNAFTSGPLASTNMACPSPSMQQDGSLAQFFSEQKVDYQINQQTSPTLTFTNAKGEKLVFVGTPTADTRYGSKPETIFLAVSHQTRACSDGVSRDRQCLQVKEIRYSGDGIKTHEDKEWSNFYSNIEGYEHKADTDTVLRVKRYTVKNPPADASKYTYVLDMMVSQALVK